MAQINHSTGNNQFSQEYMPFIVRWGRITNLLGVVLCFLPPLVLTFGFGFNPGLTAIITGALAQVSCSCIFWFVEPISYFPVLGIPGTYMSFLAGNGSSLRLPCSAAAQEAADVQPGTDKGTIISTLGITVSIFINIGMLLLGVILGASVLGALPASVISALNLILPALFGAMFAQFAVTQPKIGAIAIVLALGMTFLANNGFLAFFPGQPAYIIIIVSVFGTIGLSKLLFDKGQLKV